MQQVLSSTNQTQNTDYIEDQQQMPPPEDMVIINSDSDDDDDDYGGYHFNPTEEELILYLERKVKNDPIPNKQIIDAYLYQYTPQDLTDMFPCGDQNNIWYFYTPRTLKYPNGILPNRAIGDGRWKATGKDKPIISASNNATIGKRKSLVFYIGKSAKDKTDWILHEYRLPDGTTPLGRYMEVMDLVLCKVYQKPKKQKKVDDQSSEANNDENHENVGNGDTNVVQGDDNNIAQPAPPLLIMPHYMCVNDAPGTSINDPDLPNKNVVHGDDNNIAQPAPLQQIMSHHMCANAAPGTSINDPDHQNKSSVYGDDNNIAQPMPHHMCANAAPGTSSDDPDLQNKGTSHEFYHNMNNRQHPNETVSVMHENIDSTYVHHETVAQFQIADPDSIINMPGDSYSTLPPVAPTVWQNRFSHQYTYGGHINVPGTGYYPLKDEVPSPLMSHDYYPHQNMELDDNNDNLHNQLAPLPQTMAEEGFYNEPDNSNYLQLAYEHFNNQLGVGFYSHMLRASNDLPQNGMVDGAPNLVDVEQSTALWNENENMGELLTEDDVMLLQEILNVY